MPHPPSPLVRLASGACLAANLCLAGCSFDSQDESGIYFDRPVLGARENYAGFNYGGPK